LVPPPTLHPISLMRCEAVDYDTPVLPVNYHAFLINDPSDDSSVDSAYHAFMAAPIFDGPSPPSQAPTADSDFILVPPPLSKARRPKGLRGQVL
jgi:hypothetical protein